MDERSAQDAREDGAQGAAAASGAREGGERDGARRGGLMDPESWHDLAERGTPRNG
jgi:hypothetical protein